MARIRAAGYRDRRRRRGPDAYGRPDHRRCGRPRQPHGVADPEWRPCRFRGQALTNANLDLPELARSAGIPSPGTRRRRKHLSRSRRKCPCALDETRRRGRSSPDRPRSRAHQTALHVGDRRTALRAGHVRRRTARTRLIFLGERHSELLIRIPFVCSIFHQCSNLFRNGIILILQHCQNWPANLFAVCWAQRSAVSLRFFILVLNSPPT
jgi:hypothetical protein